eukprot:gene8450-11428_t
MSNYSALNDPVIQNDESYVAGSIVAKFCSMGFVTSQKWFSSYVTILDGIVSIYDSEKSYLSNPQNTVLKIALDHNFRASAIKRKNYSKDPLKIIEFYCFYIEIDNGLFMPTRQIKIGCLTQQFAEQLVHTIEVNTRN